MDTLNESTVRLTKSTPPLWLQDVPNNNTLSTPTTTQSQQSSSTNESALIPNQQLDTYVYISLYCYLTIFYRI